MARTPSSKHGHSHHASARTPQSKHRLHFAAAKSAHPSPNPSSVGKETSNTDHPVEVIGRIRDFPERKDKPVSVLQINPDSHTVRVRADFGYRDFSLDGISLSEEEDLEMFYSKFVESRVCGVKLGEKCTIMMYGPTGSGKSHTMFGCSKFPGIVYRSLKDILGEGSEENDSNSLLGAFVQVTVLEIYNEEIYDLLSSNGNGGFGLAWSKGIASKVRLEVMGKKAKNATFISGSEAGKISKEIQKVEKRRIVKSTLCNERSSRSHCMIILDVPSVGGRLMLVDMAGSENIEQAGQVGYEAKLQTSKINQGNTALKRVVESIANGDSHVPFRDSKLTMLLQDSFEDDKSKILMILCASPDPKEIHKTISTLEYGAKAKCIVRGPHTPNKAKADFDNTCFHSRIAAMDQFIFKLQMENKRREREFNEAQKQLLMKEKEVAQLRAKIELIEGKASEDVINLKVNERTQFLKHELEVKLKECQKLTNEYVEWGRKKMEEKVLEQQQEVEKLRRRLEEIESEICSGDNGLKNMDGCNFAQRFLKLYGEEDPGMVKSMELDMGKSMELDLGKQESFVPTSKIDSQGFMNYSRLKDDDHCGGLSTVFEEGEAEEDDWKDNSELEEVKKEVIEEKTVYSNEVIKDSSYAMNFCLSSLPPETENVDLVKNGNENPKDSSSARRRRIQNIFTLCGNNREISQHVSTPMPAKRSSEIHNPQSSPEGSVVRDLFSDENLPLSDSLKRNQAIDDDNLIEVYVKWEASKENPGKPVTTVRAVKGSTLHDLRKQIEAHLGANGQSFIFLILGDPAGGAVPKEKEASTQTSKLPVCNDQVRGHLACLRRVNSHLPLSPLENKLPLTPMPCSVPCATVLRHHR